MATVFYIHEDQENIPINEIRHGKQQIKGKNCEDVKRREALGRVNNVLNNDFGNALPIKLEKKESKNNLRQPLRVISSISAVTKATQQHGKSSYFKDKGSREKLDLAFCSSSDSSTTAQNGHETMEEDNVENMSITYCPSDTPSQCTEDDNCNLTLYRNLEYREDIQKYLFEIETRHRPHPRYMSRQPELTYQMRATLVDWLVTVSDEYQMAADTLHLAVCYIDRFLSKMSVVRTKLQLVGVTAMMIAAKYEEIYPPDVSEFVFLTSETYTTKQLVRMEQLILRVLSFDLSAPTIQCFIDEFINTCGDEVIVHKMAMYISELCLVDSANLLEYLPSKVAAGCVALARHHLNVGDMWPENLASVSGYSLKDLTPIVKTQQRIFEDSPGKPLQAVNTKYKAQKFDEITNRKLVFLEDSFIL